MRITPAVWSALALAVTAHLSSAQCKVGPETNEAKLLAYYAVPLAFSASGFLEPMPSGAVRGAFEVAFIPAPPDELRHTSICFLPKEENSQLSSVLPRPRIAVGLPNGFFIEATYLPPITVSNATPNMASLALGFVRQLSGPWGYALRAHTTFGKVRGPITCPEDALQMTNPNEACYGSEPSNDTYHPNIFGFEAAGTWAGADRFRAYGGAGYSIVRPRFQVGFQPANAPFDSTRVEANVTRVTLMVGGRYRLWKKLLGTAEVYSVPKDMTTVRLGVSISTK